MQELLGSSPDSSGRLNEFTQIQLSRLGGENYFHFRVGYLSKQASNFIGLVLREPSRNNQQEDMKVISSAFREMESLLTSNPIAKVVVEKLRVANTAFEAQRPNLQVSLEDAFNDFLTDLGNQISTNNLLTTVPNLDSAALLSRLMAPRNERGTSPIRQKLHQFLIDCHEFTRSFPRPKCFISYCWGPDGELRQDLQIRLKELKLHLESLGAIVYLDVSNLESDINQFMEKIQECDFIFLIGTPALKARLQEAGENNLKTEFSHIEDRLSAKPGCLLPLIFQAEGDFGSAFRQTMPERLIKQHNVLVRDCRQYGDEWTDPNALIPYIEALSGNGYQPGSSLGIIPSIYTMSSQASVMQRYSTVKRGLTDGISVLVSRWREMMGLFFARVFTTLSAAH